MDTIKRKLTSRKMWIALAGVIVGLAAIMGAGEAEIATVAGAITATASAVAYIVTEGRLDAAAIGNAAEAIQNAIDVVMEDVPDMKPEELAALVTPVKELKPPPQQCRLDPRRHCGRPEQPGGDPIRGRAGRLHS